MRRSRLLPLFVTLLSLWSSGALAASFIVPSDAELVRSAPVIVVGTAGVSDAFEQAGEIYTRTRLSIHESIRGPIAPGQTIDVVGMGGVLDDRFVIVSGVPRFADGERVLLFLTKNAHDQWAVKDLMLGKFTFAQWEGIDLLVRGIGSEHVFGWTPDGRMHDEPLRSAEGFLDFVRLAGRSGSDAYRLEGSQEISAVQPNATGDPYNYLSQLFFAGGGGPAGYGRWESFVGEAGDYRVNGTQPGLSSGQTMAAVEAAVGAWQSAPNSSIDIAVVGTTSAGFTGDNINAIVFDQPFPPEAGEAVGFARIYGGAFHTFAGKEFISLTQGDVIVRNSSGYSQNLVAAIVCHEVGHTLGFRHSNEASPPSSDAIMYFQVSGDGGAVLRSWDLEAATYVYGTGQVPCTPPSITNQPDDATINSGSSTTLSVNASGTSPLSYQWARRTGTNAFANISGATNASLNTGALTTTTDFRVTITNACGAVTSSVATVTVRDCDVPAFTGQPQSETIQSGQSTTLAVSVTGTNPISLQWYRRTGTSGGFSAVSGATSSSLNTGALTQTMQYIVRANNACGTTDSAVATITVQATCQPPSITSQPQDAALPPGGGQVTLSVGASGTTPLTVTWFRTSSAGTTQVGSGPSINVTQAGNYFATVSNACGSVDTRVAAVSATECHPVVILVQPQSQQITSGGSVTLSVDQDGTAPFTYQWYRGNRSDTSNPVAGATSRTFTTPVLTQTTTYWVRVTNCAGAVDSQAATISVAAACTSPNITQHPQASTIAPGQRANLSVTATGTSLQYQWFRGNRGNESNPVSGATSRTFTTPVLTQTTTYWVRVSNSCGSVQSNAATVTVQSPRRRGAKPPGFN